MPRLALSACLLPLAALVACGPTVPPPDASWNVTVTGLSTDCTSDTSGFQETYGYNLYFDGSAVEVRIGEDYFAAGTQSGCSLSYESPVWLEERDAGKLRWQILGEADFQGAAGGCDIEGDFDWYGTESVVITESEDEAVPEGCTYEMEVTGQYQAAG